MENINNNSTTTGNFNTQQVMEIIASVQNRGVPPTAPHPMGASPHNNWGGIMANSMLYGPPPPHNQVIYGHPNFQGQAQGNPVGWPPAPLTAPPDDSFRHHGPPASQWPSQYQWPPQQALSGTPGWPTSQLWSPQPASAMPPPTWIAAPPPSRLPTEGTAPTVEGTAPPTHPTSANPAQSQDGQAGPALVTVPPPQISATPAVVLPPRASDSSVAPPPFSPLPVVSLDLNGTRKRKGEGEVSDSEGSRDGAKTKAPEQRAHRPGRGVSRSILAPQDSWNLEPAIQATIPIKPHTYHSYVEDVSLQALAARSATRYTLCTGVLITNLTSLSPPAYGARLDTIFQASLPAISYGGDGISDSWAFQLGSTGVGDQSSWVSFRKLRDVTVAGNPLPVKVERNSAVSVTYSHRVSEAGQPTMSLLKMVSATQQQWLETSRPTSLLVCRCYARLEGDIDLIAQFLLLHFQKVLSITQILVLPYALHHTKALPEIIFNVMVFSPSLIPSYRSSLFPGINITANEHPGCVHLVDLRFHYAPHAGIFFNQPFDPRLSARSSDYPKLRKPLSPHSLPGGSRYTYIQTEAFGIPHPQQVAQSLYHIPSTGPSIVQGILFLQRGAEGAPPGYKITWKSNGYINLIAAQIKTVMARLSSAAFHLEDPPQEDPHRPTLLLSLLNNCSSWRSAALPLLEPIHPPPLCWPRWCPIRPRLPRRRCKSSRLLIT